MHQIGRLKMKFLMFFLAIVIDELILIDSGTRFQVLAESFLNVEFKILQPYVSFNNNKIQNADQKSKNVIICERNVDVKSNLFQLRTLF